MSDLFQLIATRAAALFPTLVAVYIEPLDMDDAAGLSIFLCFDSSDDIGSVRDREVHQLADFTRHAIAAGVIEDNPGVTIHELPIAVSVQFRAK